MKRFSTSRLFAAAIVGTAALSLSLPSLAQVNAAAAEEAFDDFECTKCHSVDQPKKGPSLKKTAAKYKGKPDGEKTILEHMSKIQNVKQEDGKEVKHPIIDSKDPNVRKNVAKWILSH